MINVMTNSDKVYQLVKLNGPLLPVDIARELKTSIIMAAAMLSEHVSNNLIKLSHTKIGGSPVYYVDDQKEKLQNLYKYLHEKEKKAYDLLKEKKVLYDRAQHPTTRVALRQIKDFAKPLEVSIKDKKVLFWKWYLLPNVESRERIKEVLKLELTQEDKLQAELKDKPKPEETQIKDNTKKEEEKTVSERSESITQKTFEDKTFKDSFLVQLKKYFSENNIDIINLNILRKDRDIEFKISIPSNVGKLTYYSRARNKKKCNEGDLSSAYVQGEVKKLPVLFLTTGELTKRAKEMLKNEFKNITIKKI